MRLLAKLNGKPIATLVDIGATHNFNDEMVVKQLGLIVSFDKRFVVTVADREKIRGVGYCHNVIFTIQGIPFTSDLLVISIR